MSTDYYLACDSCQECYQVAQDGMSGFGFYSKEPRCMAGIGHFLSIHVLHGIVRLLPEHLTDDYKIVEWPKTEDKPEKCLADATDGPNTWPCVCGAQDPSGCVIERLPIPDLGITRMVSLPPIAGATAQAGRAFQPQKD